MSNGLSEKQNTVAHKRATSAYEFVATLLMSLLILVILFTFFLRVVRVEGPSMETTLGDGDRLLLYSCSAEYQRGDIVVVDRYTVAPLIKRVIAVGGDTLKISDSGMVYLNGALLNEPYVMGATMPRDCLDAVTIPEGYVFVMGDNRVESHDSRAADIGIVSVKDIVGKAVYRILPLSDFGNIYTNLEYSSDR